MTANRLGFFPFQEMHLQRLLWRAVRELKEVEPPAWQQIAAVLYPRKHLPGASVYTLLEPVIHYMWKSSQT